MILGEKSSIRVGLTICLKWLMPATSNWKYIIIEIYYSKLICSGLREDEDGRDLGRRWLQQEHRHRWFWLCLRETPNVLVFPYI